MTHNGPLIALMQLGAEIMARIKAGDQAKTKANDHYLAAGLRLLEARDRATTNFPAFLTKHRRGLKRSRAYQLMRIAGGKTTIETERTRTAERVREHRATKDRPLRNGHSSGTIEAKPKRTTAFDVIEAWMQMSPEEDRRVLQAIGLRRILAALPEAWEGDLEKWIEERQSPSSPVEIEIGPDLSIPDFLRRPADAHTEEAA